MRPFETPGSSCRVQWQWGRVFRWAKARLGEAGFFRLRSMNQSFDTTVDLGKPQGIPATNLPLNFKLTACLTHFGSYHLPYVRRRSTAWSPGSRHLLYVSKGSTTWTPGSCHLLYVSRRSTAWSPGSLQLQTVRQCTTFEFLNFTSVMAKITYWKF